ncbi:hypothetical protein SASPL_138010 [Salvia splendens]|uniref:J domain-containing protein n=1 Tax=Salvia splendens TaxID=180675 RepID=A0A8X8WUQ4_SALSN|nr:uncharacterized protein LOC121763286 [Salvia splendens]XP_042015215.1 uncharacterized protein LOC121763286 [Salvia splendens]KAG6401164.1 hypothetical protein SASPL_138010 [Salvia splendens]
MGNESETQTLLNAADYLLQSRNFADCINYAARAHDSDPTNPAPARILSTASVLSASKISPTHHDYYAVLNLPYFDSDSSRIDSTFETLTSILDPNTNRCPFASEAFDLAVKAWSVLSNPLEKAGFDAELQAFLDPAASTSATFWTVCPYCYYVYEYDKVFEDCCLKCQNQRCRRVLHAVPIAGPPPPPDVVARGQYCCPGFMPFALRSANGDPIRDKLWLPFAPLHHRGSQAHVNGEKAKTEGNSRKRMKSVPWKSKKLLGRGINIDGGEANFVYGVREDGCFNDEPKPCSGGLEFLNGDDDVFVSLPCEFDMGNGRPVAL